MNDSQVGKFSPLHIASSRENGVEFVRTLIENGADVNLTCDVNDTRGWTALHLACLSANKATVILLIQKCRI